MINIIYDKHSNSWGGAWAVQSYLGGSNGLALALALEPRVLPVGAHGCNQYEDFMINIFIHKFN